MGFTKRACWAGACAAASLVALSVFAAAPEAPPKGIWAGFEPNRGQAADAVAFLARSAGGTLYLSRDGATLVFPRGEAPAEATPRSSSALRPGPGAVPKAPALSGLRLRFPGAAHGAPLVGLDPLPGIRNVFLGKEPSRWRAGLPLYEKVRWEGLYEGVDAEFTSNGRGFEFDFVVAPGVSPDAIRLRVEDLSGRHLRLTAGDDGRLRLETGGRTLTLAIPHVYVGEGPGRHEVTGRFRALRTGEVGFEADGRDRRERLVIDPSLEFSTYLGGSQMDRAYRMAADTSGSLYVTGITQSNDFPLAGGSYLGGYDTFVVKLAPDGQSVIYSTLLGGSMDDLGNGIAVDQFGQAYVGGYTNSGGFPVVGGLTGPFAGANGFVVKLNTTGAIAYSSLIGGDSTDQVTGVAVREPGIVATCGVTFSSNFYITLGAADDDTLGGSKDAFVTVFNTLATGPASVWYSSYLGGSAADDAMAVAYDSMAYLYLTGTTSSPDFPVTPNPFQPSYGGGGDGWVAVYTTGGAQAPGVVYASYLGGSGWDNPSDLKLRNDREMLVTGFTYSTNFPLAEATQPVFGGGLEDAFMTIVDPTIPGLPGLTFSTYFGGSGTDSGYALAVTDLGDFFITGATDSTDLPVVGALPGQDYFHGVEDAFVVEWETPGIRPRGGGAPLSGVGPTILTVTYLGGSDDDFGEGLVWASMGAGTEALFISGSTASSDFPLVAPLQATLGGPEDAFVAKGVDAASPCTVACDATWDHVEGQAPLTVNFSGDVFPAGCAGSPSWDWDFGDGSSHGTTQAVTHTYAAAGSYTFMLTVTVDGTGCTRNGVITVCDLACDATGPVYGVPNVPYSFTFTPDFGACSPGFSYTWSFSDGYVTTDQNPVHAFAAPAHVNWTAHATSWTSGLCDTFGAIDICALNCSVNAGNPTGPAPHTMTFDVTPEVVGPCPATGITYLWIFGDGQTGTEQSPTHVYADPGVYTWTCKTLYAGGECVLTGDVTVTGAQPGLYGSVGVGHLGAAYPLDGQGVVSLTATATPVGGGTPVTVDASGGSFSFPGLAPGDYLVKADLAYRDFVLYDAQFLGAGCAAPASGFLTKEVTSAEVPVTFNGTTDAFAEIVFPPPAVFLHGAFDCYKKWTSDDPLDPDFDAYWDNTARRHGLITFTPNYAWWGGDAAWNTKAQQVLTQVSLDLAGLHQPMILTSASRLPSCVLVAHGMGGLVARVLTSGSFAGEEAVKAVEGIVLLGVPNSGTDQALGGDSGVLSTQAVVRRFNALYPDFGDADGVVLAMAGNRDPWGRKGSSDGVVDLRSAFAIAQLACAPDPLSGETVCQPYVARLYDSGPGHVFFYSHGDLGSPASTAEILEGVLLPQVTPVRAFKAPVGGSGDNPWSPVGATIWGTTSRTSNSGGGSLTALAASPLGETLYDLRVGATDGLSVVVVTTQGSGSVRLVSPSGQTAASASGRGRAVLSASNPDPGLWHLGVTPDAGGVTFAYTAFENSPFGVRGYAAKNRYAPGDAVKLRLAYEGDPAGVVFGAASVLVRTPSGADLETVPLYDDGAHGDGAAGDGVYAGATTAPLAPGAYPLVFSAQGAFGGQAFARSAFDTLGVVNPVPLFTGVFADAPVDRDLDGLYDALAFSAQADLDGAGTYGLGADLYDAQGRFVARGAGARSVAAPGTAAITVGFDLRGAHCVQFAAPFAVRNVVLVDGDTLAPLDAWGPDVATSAYDASSFDCLPGPVQPLVTALTPDEAPRASAAAFSVAGRGFLDGCTVDLGQGVALSGVRRVSEALVTGALAVSPLAPPGPRTLTLTNPDATAAAVDEAFTVSDDALPEVALLLPADGTVLGSAPVAVAASASDDVRVARGVV